MKIKKETKNSPMLMRTKKFWKGKIWILPCILFLIISCRENLDESNFAIKTKPTIADFITQNPKFSNIKSLFHKVRLGQDENASSLFSILSSRGNYTIFLPSNESFKRYLKQNNIVHIDSLNDELAYMIATSCIIDNNNKKAFETNEFPTEGTLPIMNLSNRLLTCSLGEDAYYVINGTSKVIDADNEMSNGFVHEVDNVIAPSIKTLDRLIKDADNTKIFSYLLERTSWCDSLHENLDYSYENPNRPETIYKDPSGFISWYELPRHRYVGYTAFVEPDSVYEQELGIKIETDEYGTLVNGDDFMHKIENITAHSYGSKALGNYTHKDNAVNRFVAYHLLDGKIAYNKFVSHYNEYAYKIGDPFHPQTSNLPVNVWNYYTTKGAYPSILKVTQVGDTGFEQDMQHTIYLNRISEYADGPEDDYREISVVPGFSGITISASNGQFDNNALNGFYYPINHLLVYTPEYRNELYKRRMRIDYVSCLPELYSNNIAGTIYHCFEKGYFKNIVHQNPETQILYDMQQGNMAFNDFNGDGMHFTGMYDFTIKLPPVPIDGTYEIRMAGAHNPRRGMAQIYFGNDPDRLQPVGLPYDMRQVIGKNNPGIPWIQDTDDWSINTEIDKNLRNQGYMKAPQYITIANGQGNLPLRKREGVYGVVRRIITVANMKADESYYLRFKTALKSNHFTMQIDYLEFASKAVYNGTTAEDIW